MRLLLDTSALLFWLDGDRRLTTKARRAMSSADHEILVSAASAWEIATKYRIGKLPHARDVALDFTGCVRAQGFEELVITSGDAQQAGLLVWPHRDPFDRMIAAQALRASLTLVSSDEVFDEIGVTRLW
jgi:PIN domain nuclease of toxin-antitoxin system